MRALFYRLIPYFFAFIASEAFLRIKLGIVEWNNLDYGLLSLVESMAVGLIPDIAAFIYILPVLLIIQFCIPKKIHGKKSESVIQAAIFSVFLFVMLFTVVSEWLFWQELTSRFNFIAVDYLVYMDEVVGNIRESYPVAVILSVLVVMAATGGYIYARKAKLDIGYDFAWKQKLAVIAGVALLGGYSFFAVSEDTSEIFDNNYENEISKDGVFSLFTAFRNNELSYDKFYLNEKNDAAMNDLRKSLSKDGLPFTDDGITRHVEAKGTPIKPNIVLITVESLSAEYMGIFGNKDNITPNLDRISKESLLFTNLYAIGTRTVYGLSAITLSIPPMPGNAIARRPENGNLFSLGSELNNMGYESRFIYGGYGYFDNMNTFFSGNGYRIIDRSSLKDDEITFANIWGVCDEDVYNRTIKENDDAYKQGKPFFDMIMTTSNHQPFTYPDGKIDIPMGKGRAGGVKYTDYTINKFINDAKKRPWFDNTIFVIVADHTAGSSGKMSLTPEKHHIPMMFYSPKLIKPQVVSKMVSQIDLAPTLLGIMNASYDTRFYGHDALKEDAPERAFIGNYEHVGLLEPNSLTILKPQKKAEEYINNDGKYERADKVDDSLLAETIAYFQDASQWRELNHEIQN